MRYRFKFYWELSGECSVNGDDNMEVAEVKRKILQRLRSEHSFPFHFKVNEVSVDCGVWEVKPEEGK